jgi:hypothetical protein
VKRNSLHPDVEERAQEDLLATLGRIDLLDDEKRECAKALRAILDEEWSRVRMLRDVLEGRIAEETFLPGLEEKVTERDRKIGAQLRKAVDAISRITGASPTVEDRSAEGLVRAAEKKQRGGH